MSSSLTPSKRPNNGTKREPSGKRKVQSSAAKSPGNSSKSSTGNIVFRMLCDSSKADSFVGDSCALLLQIREEYGCRILVEEPVLGCDERVIIITHSNGESTIGSGLNPENKLEKDEGDEGAGAAIEENGKKDEYLKSLTGEVVNARFGSTALQKVLLLVFEKLVEGESLTRNGNGNKSESCILRLLVLPSQVDCLLGKGGTIIKKMSANSGAQIQIIPKDKLPPLASSSDKLIQITGEVDAVRKALQSISQQLIEKAIRYKETSPSYPNPSNFHSPDNSFSKQESHHVSRHFAAQLEAPFDSRPLGIGNFNVHISPTIPRFRESDLHNQMKPSLETLSFRLLCNSDRVGGIIGKGGTGVNFIQQETGCEIQILETTPETEDRIIVISGPVHPEDRVSAVQDALLRVQNRILRPASDEKGNFVVARILVSSNKIGCLIGKGGSIIGEMRRSSGAHIRVLGKDKKPKFVSEDDDVVQIQGGYDAVQEALLQITDRLKLNFFRDVFPSIEHPPNPALFDPVPPLPSFMRRREVSPHSKIFPNLGPSNHKFDPVGLPSGIHAPVRDIFRPHLPTHMPDRRSWGPEEPIDGGPFRFLDLPGDPPRRLPGFAGGAGPAIITNITIEVVVPRSAVPSIYGEDGFSLTQICMISDAKVTIIDSNSDATETVIIISGSPEQTQAAQSLIQAFVMLENEES
ncbi:hypothetical protein SAY87_000630 [Trapa incisa]|uniref:K Homology domain-containing protein n=1 Tax=Trapa incisa TaxID=236973 RepID=A0AAN7JGC3_9MYRT|nr:hypothetical protein SAY87_000630 [Trapa incisa]